MNTGTWIERAVNFRDTELVGEHDIKGHEMKGM